MQKPKSTGYIVKTNTGLIGRTYHILGKFHGKVPVFFETDIPNVYSEKFKMVNIHDLKKRGEVPPLPPPKDGDDLELKL